MIRFEIPGKPCAKQSVRFRKSGGSYQPKDVTEYRSLVALFASEAYPGEPLEGPIDVAVTAWFDKPQSWSKKRKDAAVYHVSAPDPDNLAKAILDGIKGVLIRDDKQVAKLEVSKRYTDAGAHVSVLVGQLK